MSFRASILLFLLGSSLLRADLLTVDNSFYPSFISQDGQGGAQGVVFDPAFDPALGTLNSVALSWTANFNGVVYYRGSNPDGSTNANPDSLPLDVNETATASVDNFQASQTVNVNEQNVYWWDGCQCTLGFLVHNKRDWADHRQLGLNIRKPFRCDRSFCKHRRRDRHFAHTTHPCLCCAHYLDSSRRLMGYHPHLRLHTRAGAKLPLWHSLSLRSDRCVDPCSSTPCRRSLEVLARGRPLRNPRRLSFLQPSKYQVRDLGKVVGRQIPTASRHKTARLWRFSPVTC